jgi:hypothetical protein
MMTWKPDPILRALLGWTALSTLIFWLPFVRGLFDGATYEWSLAGLGGKGVSGDYWMPALGVVLALSIRYLGWRGARIPFHALLLLWVVPLGAGATWLTLTQPEDFRFQGDSLGIDISLAWAGPAIFGGFALLGIFWVIRDLRSGRRRETPPWMPVNRWMGIALAALLPIQFALLRFGEPHGTTDQIGVILTILQWFLVGAALAPRRRAGAVGVRQTSPGFG